MASGSDDEVCSSKRPKTKIRISMNNNGEGRAKVSKRLRESEDEISVSSDEVVMWGKKVRRNSEEELLPKKRLSVETKKRREAVRSVREKKIAALDSDSESETEGSGEESIIQNKLVSKRTSLSDSTVLRESSNTDVDKRTIQNGRVKSPRKGTCEKDEDSSSAYNSASEKNLNLKIEYSDSETDESESEVNQNQGKLKSPSKTNTGSSSESDTSSHGKKSTSMKTGKGTLTSKETKPVKSLVSDSESNDTPVMKCIETKGKTNITLLDEDSSDSDAPLRKSLNATVNPIEEQQSSSDDDQPLVKAKKGNRVTNKEVSKNLKNLRSSSEENGSGESLLKQKTSNFSQKNRKQDVVKQKNSIKDTSSVDKKTPTKTNSRLPKKNSFSEPRTLGSTIKESNVSNSDSEDSDKPLKRKEIMNKSGMKTLSKARQKCTSDESEAEETIKKIQLKKKVCSDSDKQSDKENKLLSDSEEEQSDKKKKELSDSEEEQSDKEKRGLSDSEEEPNDKKKKELSDSEEEPNDKKKKQLSDSEEEPNDKKKKDLSDSEEEQSDKKKQETNMSDSDESDKTFKNRSVKKDISSSGSDSESDMGKKTSSKSKSLKTETKKTEISASDDSSADNTKKSKSQKVVVDKWKARIERYKKYLSTSGIRIYRYNDYWKGCKNDKQRGDKLLKILEDYGLKGRPSMQKCKKLREKIERKREAEELDLDNIIDNGAGRYASRTMRRSLEQKKEREQAAEKAAAEIKERFSRIKELIDSDSSSD